jgi:hypothetical protein
MADLAYRHAGDGLAEVQFLNGNSAQGGGVISASNTAGSEMVANAGTLLDHDSYVAQSALDVGHDVHQPAPPIGGWTHDLIV